MCMCLPYQFNFSGLKMSEQDTIDMNIPSEDEDSWLAEEEVSPPPKKKLRFRAKLPQNVLELLEQIKRDTIPQSPPAQPPLPLVSPAPVVPLRPRVLTKKDLFTWVDDDGRRQVVCFNCKTVGHIHRVCPLKQIPVEVQGPPIPLMEIKFDRPPTPPTPEK
ncbi:unnamed protein product [Orchesella dallaii]|uniref:CCHC-type domain-containing protein n=1 Tax=Orchesella dallaii TaxID=48710 RepID=A0ABP1SA88_9HEXA